MSPRTDQRKEVRAERASPFLPTPSQQPPAGRLAAVRCLLVTALRILTGRHWEGPRLAAVPGHPAWCSQGHGCHGPKRAADGTVEWDHSSRVDIRAEEGHADVFPVRIDSRTPPNGRHDVGEALVLTADGTFTTVEAEAFALEIQRAVRKLDVGLDGTPAVLVSTPEPWPPHGRNRAV